MIRKFALAAVMAALLSPGTALALGLGTIEVNSALNEPFRARIPLRGIKPGELEEIRARLGDDTQFARAGLDRAFVLTTIKFKVVPRGASSGFIELSTSEPLAEPFLNFLLDVNWSKGRVLREYTVLLDPPVYGAAITSASRAVKTVDRPAQAAPAPALAPMPAPMPAPRRTGPLPDPSPAQIRAAMGTDAAAARVPRAAAPQRAVYGADSYGPVRRGQTLWSIADRVRPSGVSIQAMMLAMLKANPDGFSINNINALKTGAVLRIPQASELSSGRAAALAEVTRQHALWDEFRQTLTRNVPAQPAGSPPTATGTAATAGTAAASDATASGELKLVGGDSTGAGTGAGGDVKALRDELTMAQEEADAARRENEDLKSRLGEAETLVGDLKRLVEIKEEALADLQNKLATDAMPTGGQETTPGMVSETAPETVTATMQETAPETVTGQEQPPVGESATEASPGTEPVPTTETMTEAATTPPTTPEVATAPAQPPPPKMMEAPAATSFLDEINDLLPVPLWSILAALGVGLVGLGGLRFARARKAATAGGVVVAGAAAGALGTEAGSSTLMDELDAIEAAGDATEVPEGLGEAGGVDPDAATLMGDTTPNFAEVGGDTHVEELEDDPLAEVNVYLAYERFEQAEELVRDAIASYPDREDYRLKLIEVFYAAKDPARFEAAAQEMREALGPDHPEMVQVADWWNELDTGRPLFSETGPMGGPTTVPQDAMRGGETVGHGTVTADGGLDTGVDFDLSFETSGESGEQSSVDFDIGAGPDEASSGESSVDFDLGDIGGIAAAGAAGVATMAAATAGATAGEGTGLDFDVKGFDDSQTLPSLRDGTDTVLTGADDGGLGGGETGLDFDLGGADFEATATEAPGLASGAETGLDFNLGVPGGESAAGASSALDFDLGDTGPLDAAQAGASSALNFDLGEPVSSGDSEAGAASGALDFDLGDAFTSDEAGAASSLDFDLGEAAATGEASALDFDLGDASTGGGSSALDFDLGDAAAGGAGSTLDFDPGAATEAPGTGAATGSESALDLDLGDSFTPSGDTETSTQPMLADLGPAAVGESDMDLDLDLDLSDGGDDSLGMTSDGDNGLDLDLSLGGDEPGPITEVGSGSQTGLELPSMHFDTLEMDTQPEGSFETVKLASSGPGKDQDESIDSLHVDTEFRDVFGAGDRSSSDLDLNLEGDDFTSPDSTVEEVKDMAFPDTEILRPGFGEATDGDLDDSLLTGGGDEMQTKLDLAQAYIDMGDAEGARSLLGEVASGGNDEQKKVAAQMIDGLG